MTPKIFPRGSKVNLGGRDPPKKFFSKSEDVGEIMQNYYGSDLMLRLVSRNGILSHGSHLQILSTSKSLTFFVCCIENLNLCISNLWVRLG